MAEEHAHGPAPEQLEVEQQHAEPELKGPPPVLAFAGEVGNQTFASRFGVREVSALPAAPEVARSPVPSNGAVIAREKSKAAGKAGFTISPQISKSGAKITVEGTGGVEKGFSYVKLGASVTGTGELEATWSDDAATSVGPKGGKATGGDASKSVEADIPIWKSATEKQLEEGVQATLEDRFTPISANLVLGGEKGSNKGKKEDSYAAAVGVKLKMKTGDELTVKVQLASLKTGEGSVVDLEGPMVSGEYEFIWPFGPKLVHTCKDGTKINVQGKVSLKPAITVKPDYVAIGTRVAESLLGRVASAAAPIAIPLAAAAAIGYGMYVSARNAEAASRAATDGVKARKDAEKACNNYARTLLTGEGGGDDVGSKHGMDDFKKIEEEGEGLPKEDILNQIKETKGGHKKIYDDNLIRMKDEMFKNAVAAFEEANKEDYSWWEELGEDWGRRGVYRTNLRIVLYGDS